MLTAFSGTFEPAPVAPPVSPNALRPSSTARASASPIAVPLPPASD